MSAKYQFYSCISSSKLITTSGFYIFIAKPLSQMVVSKNRSCEHLKWSSGEKGVIFSFYTQSNFLFLQNNFLSLQRNFLSLQTKQFSLSTDKEIYSLYRQRNFLSQQAKQFSLKAIFSIYWQSNFLNIQTKQFSLQSNFLSL